MDEVTNNENANEEAALEKDELEAIAFVGQVLGPLFWEDPETGNAGSAIEAMANIDPVEAAQSWPFARPEDALPAFGQLKRGASKSTKRLADEYHRLFVGPFAKVAPPWGSVYTDKDCVIFGASTLALRTWMRENGIQRLATGERTPDDHMGLMLMLLAWLAGEKPQLVDEFLRDHLLTWSSHFLDIVAAETTEDFYRGLAGLTKATLEGIQDVRGIHVSYPRYYR